ncbi:MAG TPA: sigma-70 family RNA polymerase sigma factor [Methylomirabilota bacterium]|nr:sigma-70 family RNA polymerase sigma factor [Methylomirabilota bacterium]
MDDRAFAELTEQYAGRLYAVAYRMLGNRADAEDAVQRALLKCFQARTSYSPRWAVSTWLYRALTNVCIDELRRRRVRGDVQSLDEEAPRRGVGGGTATPPASIAVGVDLARALDTVPREARMLLALRYVDGLGYGELARIRGISINTVKSQLKRGKAIMKKALEAGGHDGSD